MSRAGSSPALETPEQTLGTFDPSSAQFTAAFLPSELSASFGEAHNGLHVGFDSVIFGGRRCSVDGEAPPPTGVAAQLAQSPSMSGPSNSSSSSGGGGGGAIGSTPETTQYLTGFKHALRSVQTHWSQWSWKQILWVAFLLFLVTIGNFLQIVMLNFWLSEFPDKISASNYTVFALPGIIFCLFFVCVQLVYMVLHRPNLSFAKSIYGWKLLISIGFTDAVNSWMAAYAASYTSEVLQALFQNSSPLYAVFLSKWLLRDDRQYLNRWIVSVFVLTIIGVVLVTALTMMASSTPFGNVAWIIIYFASIPIRVLQNVYQSLYMIVFTYDVNFTDWLARKYIEEDIENATRLVDGKEPLTADELRARRGNTFTPSERALEHSQDSTPTLPKTVSPPLLSTDAVAAAADSVTTMQPNPTPPPCTSAQPYERPPTQQHISTLFYQQPSCSSFNTEDLEGGLKTDISFSTITQHDINDSETRAAMRSGVNEVMINHRDRSCSMGPVTTDPAVSDREGDDTTVKIFMLAAETTWQLIFTLALLPADALPWFGYSDSVGSTWSNFMEAIHYIFTDSTNAMYCFLYTSGFVCSYVGAAYLNFYSVALCSIVTQLSSPLTALVFVLIPSWNVSNDDQEPLAASLCSIILLSIAALVYVFWEEDTANEKEESELRLKRYKLKM